MEFVNKIILQGIVGAVRKDARCTSFSLVVEENYNLEGENIIDTIWFNCRAFSDLSVNKGDWVRVEGRSKIFRYLTQDDAGRITYEVIVEKLEKL